MSIGRLFCPTLRWREESGFGHEEPLIEVALARGVGGFLLFGGTIESVAELTTRLRAAAGHRLLIASDLERGAGQQVRGLAELPPPLALASLDDLAVVRGAGMLTGAEALRVGINWVLAPVADLDLEPANPIVQSRSFGEDPDRVAGQVAAWIAGCQATGAMACVKHFPGHGRTSVDSHDRLPRVECSREALERADLTPFRAAIAAGVAGVMTAHVAFPSLDASGAPATCSPAILGYLRETLGFEGLVATDALTMAGALAGRGPEGAAVDAVRAGVDVLLDPSALESMVAALEREAARDPGLRDRVDDSLARVSRAAAATPADAGDFVPTTGSALAVADWLLAAPLRRGIAPSLRAPLDVVVVDDDRGGRFPPSSPSDQVAVTLGEQGVPLGPGGSRVAVVLAEPRASKGRAGLGAESRAALAAAGAELIILCAHPRLMADLPDGPPVLLAWHRQRLMQQAAARWLRDRVR